VHLLFCLLTTAAHAEEAARVRAPHLADVLVRRLYHNDCVARKLASPAVVVLLRDYRKAVSLVAILKVCSRRRAGESVEDEERVS
jgi:hypothetical protein